MSDFYPDLQVFLAAAFDQATIAPRIYNSYEQAQIPRERRQSFLGDSTQGVTLIPDPEEGSDPTPSAQQTPASSGTVDVTLCDGSTLRCVGQIIPP
jgi:hypothetical protein